MVTLMKHGSNHTRAHTKIDTLVAQYTHTRGMAHTEKGMKIERGKGEEDTKKVK